MIDRDTARSIALAEITRPSLYGVEKPECVIVDEHTLEEDFGWVFFYQSRQYLETGDFSYKLGGNAPIIVNSQDGSVSVTGTAGPVEKYITQYRASLDEELRHERG